MRVEVRARMRARARVSKRVGGSSGAHQGRGRRLEGLQPCGGNRGHVDVRVAVHDLVGEHAADAGTGEDADGVEASGDVVVAQLGRLADDGRQVGRERLGAAEELLGAHLETRGHAPHGLLEKRRDPLPIWIELAEGEGVRHALDRPRRGVGLEEANLDRATPRLRLRVWV